MIPTRHEGRRPERSISTTLAMDGEEPDAQGSECSSHLSTLDNEKARPS